MAVLTGAGILVTFVLRVNLSPVAPLVQQDFHLSDFELGLVLSAFLWIYTALQPIAGLITDRYGAKLSLLVGGLATSILTILTGFANSFVSLFAVRTLIGVTQAPNFVSGAKVTASGWFREDERARATSIWIAGGRLGPVVAFPLAAWLGVRYGWQSVFFVTGIIGLLWCVVWYAGFEDRPKGSRVDVSERKTIRESIGAAASPLGFGLAVASFGQGYVAYYLNLWLPTYLVREHGFSILNAGVLGSLPLIAAVATVLIVGGGVSDYVVKKGGSPFKTRRSLFAVGMVLTALMLFSTAYAPNAYTALAFLCLAGASLGFSTPSLWVALVEAAPKSIAGTMGGIQNFGGNVAGIVVAVATGYILQVTGSFFIALLIGSAASILGATAAMFLVRPRVAE